MNGYQLPLYDIAGAFPLWVYTAHGDRLHAVAELEAHDEEWWGYGGGLTVCGRHSNLSYPGVFSRMGMPRCAHCCRILKIPRGIGVPKNDLTLRELFGYPESKPIPATT